MQEKLEKLLKLDNSIYADKELLKGSFTKLNSVRLNANMKEDELKNCNFDKLLKDKEYLIIDMDASNEYHQKNFLSMIKDKKYRAYHFENIKVIVCSSNIDIICKEILGQLTIV